MTIQKRPPRKNPKFCYDCGAELEKNKRSICGPCAVNKTRRHRFKHTYGITDLDYRNMLIEQRGLCAICGDPPAKEYGLHVDHDHASGQVRGLLCRGCNHGIGQLREDPDLFISAICYLERFRDSVVD